MTPNAILHTPVLGNAFAGIHVAEEFFHPIGQKPFDPKSLQEQKTADEYSAGLKTTRHRAKLRSFFDEVGQIQRRTGAGPSRSRASESTALPAHFVLSESARQTIGDNGLNRLREFTRYQPGWDLGEGKPLASRSVVLLSAFLSHLPELAPYRPSLFMTHEGNLELGFEDAEGRSISIEFYPDRVDYYLEGLGEEQTVKLDLIYQLIEKVRSLIS